MSTSVSCDAYGCVEKSPTNPTLRTMRDLDFGWERDWKWIRIA